jgi:hypothetical protein
MAGRRAAAADATKAVTDRCGAAAADKLSGPVSTRHDSMDYSELLALAPMWYVAFLLSLTCHEAAQSISIGDGKTGFLKHLLGADQ